MDPLRDVKSCMEFWGWSDGGGPGSEKLDADGKVVAKHGDAVWIRDVDDACETLDRLRKRVAGHD